MISIFFNIINFMRIKSLVTHKYIKKNYFIVVQLQLSAFPPQDFPQPKPNPPPSLASTLPLDFVPVSFIVVPEKSSPDCTLPPPLWLLLDCS